MFFFNAFGEISPHIGNKMRHIFQPAFQKTVLSAIFFVNFQSKLILKVTISFCGGQRPDGT